MTTFPRVAIAGLVSTLCVSGALAQLPAPPSDSPNFRQYYQDSTWQPRAILPATDSLSGTFWPKSPEVHITYDDPGFDPSRLSPAPAPGVYPRVLLTPTDIDEIRARIALGDKAPAAFRVMWERVKRSRSAFVALVTKDEGLGHQLAAQFVKMLQGMDAKIEKMNLQADRDNLWSLERSIIASGDPDPAQVSSLSDYDYLHDFMTPDEQALAQHVIGRIVKHRISNFMTEPDHFMINNHLGFGMDEYVPLILMVEGTKDFDQQVYDRAIQKARAMLDWYLDDDGMCYESIKGWLDDNAFVAFARRDPSFMKHDHLRAKMRFFQAALRWENGQWHIRDEMRASAFHVIWMMHYFHPKDEGIDFLYSASFSTHDFLTNADAKWPNPVGISPELLVLFAIDPMAGPDGKPIDWNDQANVDKLHLPLTWQDNTRGYVDTRNSWKKDDLHVGFVCKQDFFYGGHEGSENNRLTLWKNGVNWVKDMNMLFIKATFLENMLTVDGKGCHWPPAPGTWLGVKESPEGLIAAGDGKDGYAFSKVSQVHPLDFPSVKLGYFAPFAEGNFDFNRDQQIAYNPRTVKWEDGYAHTDYGLWSGEERFVESYRLWNPMDADYRTVHVAKGAHPYVLVIDDAKKDSQSHQFNWSISMPPETVVVDGSTCNEVQFQGTEPGSRDDDLILGINTPLDPKTGKRTPKEGDPLCLVRVLWRNTDYGFLPPSLQHFGEYALLNIPAHAVTPEYRVLIYPFIYRKEELPTTEWNSDHTQLSVHFKDQNDTYQLRSADGGRTALEMSRGDKTVLTSNLPPARPVLIVRGARFDANDLRYTRYENEVPLYKVNGSADIALALENAVPAAKPVNSPGLPDPAPSQLISTQGSIHYTMDGADPTLDSPVYDGASVTINQTCTLKARVIDPAWPCGPTSSEVLQAKFNVMSPEPGTAEAPGGSRPGVLARVYEKKTVMWNNGGFFEANKVMMPSLFKEKPVATAILDSIELPYANPTHPLEQQAKGFYRFTGWFHAPQPGVYQFSVDSCGPVTLDVGTQTAIEETGIFHMQQKVRKGEAVLDAGWHPLELVICDPLFWNINSVDPMPFAFSYQIDGGSSETIRPADLCCSPDPGTELSLPPGAPFLQAKAGLPQLEPGLDLAMYDRTGLRHAPNLLDIDSEHPYLSEHVNALMDNTNRNAVFVYNGYFNAPTDGVYAFDLPARTGGVTVLGSLPGMCENQLRIDDEIIVQRGVPGRMPTRQANLQKGWHAISLRFGPSLVAGTVAYPNGQTRLFDANLFSRAVQLDVAVNGVLVNSDLQEIYAPCTVTLALPSSLQKSADSPGATIKYTIDGKNTVDYTQPVQIDRDTNIAVEAYDRNGQLLTGLSSYAFHLVKEPQAGRIATVRFDKWNGQTGDFEIGDKAQAWIGNESTLGSDEKQNGKTSLVAFPLLSPTLDSNGMPAKDVNISRPVSNAALKLHHIQMRQEAITVALWMKTSQLTGSLFGKDGYNAFGKSYKTVKCSLVSGQIDAGHLRGGQIKADEWNHIVLTVDTTETSIYLNGKKVASGPGSPNIATDALDFFVNESAHVSEIDLFDRVLGADEVQHLYDNQKAEEMPKNP